MDMAGMLIKSLGIDPEDMKRKGEQIYEWVAGKIESIDSALIRIEAQNETLIQQNSRILSIMGIPADSIAPVLLDVPQTESQQAD
jgi:hypothetical protein